MRKSIALIIGAIFLLSSFSVYGEGVKKGDKLTLIKFDKGEMLGSGQNNEYVKVSLTKEKADKGKMYSCKIELKKRGSEAQGEEGAGFPGISASSGILAGKRANWKDYDTLNIKYINTSEKPLACTMLIGDKQSYERWRYGNYVERNVVFQPGENVLSLDITGLQCSGGGRALDLENMRGFGFWAPTRTDDYVLYILDIWLEKE